MDLEETIIFEDDITLFSNFYDKLQIYMKQLPDDWDIFFFGSGWNLHIPEKVRKDNQYVYFKSNNVWVFYIRVLNSKSNSCILTNTV